MARACALLLPAQLAVRGPRAEGRAVLLRGIEGIHVVYCTFFFAIATAFFISFCCHKTLFALSLAAA